MGVNIQSLIAGNAVYPTGFNKINSNFSALNTGKADIYTGKTTAPSVNDDTTLGYNIGGIWLDETNDVAYVCIDNTSSNAVWTTAWSAVQNFVDLTTNQNVGGIKTFTSFPLTPSSAPTANYEAANKKYVDDNAGIVGTKAVDETSIANDYILVYNSTSGELEYQAKPTGGGSSSAPLFQVNVAGPQIVGKLYTFVCNGNITAGTFRASLGVLCTGADFIIKLYKNGIEDASITIATTASATNGLYQATDTSFVSGSYVAGDVLTVSITQIGSTIAGSDLTFSLYE